MAVQTAFCGNCGNPLAPGATFCGRCGTPVTAAAAVPVPTQAGPPLQYPGYAAYPAYAYPRANPAPGRISRDHTTQIAVAMGLIFLLIIATVVVSLIAINNNTGSHQPCTQNCGPKIGQALPAPATYKSTKYGFEVDYDPSWKVQNNAAEGVQLSTDAGGVTVFGSKGGSQGLDQVIASFVNSLPSASYQDVAAVMDIKGAHLGDQNGLGAIYSANFVGSNSGAVKVRFAVIAATRNGLNVVLFAINEADAKDFASGIPEGQLFDYMCTTFRWPA